MISNHYPMTFGARYNWLVLIAMSLAGAGIRAWFVARHRRLQWRLPAVTALLVAALAIAAVAAALAPRSSSAPIAQTDAHDDGQAAELARVQGIVERRCAPCHAAHPTQAGFVAAPNGVALETLDELTRHLPQVQQQLDTRAMPLGNLTGMTPEERTLLLHWVEQALAGTP
jgi:uncharacterized membrane protein